MDQGWTININTWQGPGPPREGIVAILLQKWLSDYKYNSLAKNTPFGVQNLHICKKCALISFVDFLI